MCVLTFPSLTWLYPFSFEMPVLHFCETINSILLAQIFETCLLIMGYMYLNVCKHIIESILKGNYSVLKIKEIMEFNLFIL